MNIVILRHGEAENFADSDENRQLTNNGRQQVHKAAECLQHLALSFDQVWVSPYLRTQQTAEVVTSVSSDLSCVTKAFLVPESNPDSVIDMIEKSTLKNLLIVSHQPLVSALVGLMVEGNTRHGPPMSPASMVCIKTGAVLAGCCTLAWVRHAPNYEFGE